MDKDNSYTISFGAFDSELKGWEYTIPEGMEAEIKNGKIIVREKESEDERIRKEMLDFFKQFYDIKNIKSVDVEPWIAWLEKQGEQNLANSAKTCKVEQNLAWSEEDEYVYNEILKRVADKKLYKHDLEYIYNWLKALKERVQPRQDLHPRYIEGKGIYVPIIDVVLNMQDEPKEMTWDEAKDIALSKEQMFVVLYYKDKINALLEKHGGQKLEGWYWTSTQASGATYAWSVSFDISYVDYYARSNGLSVRAFSAYHPESYIFKNIKG